MFETTSLQVWKHPFYQAVVHSQAILLAVNLEKQQLGLVNHQYSELLVSIIFLFLFSTSHFCWLSNPLGQLIVELFQGWKNCINCHQSRCWSQTASLASLSTLPWRWPGAGSWILEPKFLVSCRSYNQTNLAAEKTRNSDGWIMETELVSIARLKQELDIQWTSLTSWAAHLWCA